MKYLRILLIILLAHVAGAQQPASASIQGVVVLPGTGGPAADVRVELRSGLSGPMIEYVTTGVDGRFVFPRVPPGSYRLVGSRRGYVTTEYGQTQPNGPTLTLPLQPGQRADNVRLTIFPGGVISGRLTDKGQPVGIADVYAIKLLDNNGQVAFQAVVSSKTNDLGEFRIFWLPPGQYYVGAIIRDSANAGGLVVSPDGDDSPLFAQRQFLRAVLNRAIGSGAGDDARHVPTFFPSTIDPDRAVLIDVRAGAEVKDINIESPALPVVSVRGRITNLPSSTGARPPVLLVPDGIGGMLRGQYGSQVQDNGSFELTGVFAGKYVLNALAENQMARVPVEVGNQNINNLDVTLSPGFEVNGRVVVERQSPVNPDPIMTGLRVLFRPEPPIWDPVSTAVRADGTFKQATAPAGVGLQPGTYRVLVSPILILRTAPGTPIAPLPAALQNAYVKSIRLGDRDVLTDHLRIDRPLQDELQIVIGTNPGSIEGRVLNDRQQPAGAVWVALIPENSLKYKTDHKFAATDLEGKFQLQNVPPGDYKIYAWEEMERLGWQEPRVMRDYEPRGTAVRIEEGRKSTLEIVTIPAR